MLIFQTLRRLQIYMKSYVFQSSNNQLVFKVESQIVLLSYNLYAEANSGKRSKQNYLDCMSSIY